MSRLLPYYPFYVDDFDEDPHVLAMTLGEVGLYLLALNESWKRGSIPSNPKELAVLIRRPASEVKKSWLKVLPCWIENGMPGRLINPRQERERAIAAQRSENASRSARGLRAEVYLNEVNDRFANARIRALDSGSASSADSTVAVSENASTRVRETDLLDSDTIIQRWSHHRGFKKPNKALREIISEKLKKHGLTEAELTASLDGYYANEWAKAQNYPILGFIKDPHSWIVRAALEVESTPEAVVTNPQPPDALQPAQTRINYPARWNELVPAKPVTWDARRGAGSALRECEADQVFRERFDEMCRIAQKIHEVKGDAADWVTFEFAIKTNGKGVGWWRILNEFASMGKTKATPRRKTAVELMREASKADVHSRV